MIARPQPRLLIVESYGAFRRHLSDRLREESYAVFEAEKAEEAEKIARGASFDVVLLGLGGLRQRGPGLLRSLKRMRPGAEIFVMTPSEELSLALSLECMKTGAHGEILIPVDVESLIARIREALGAVDAAPLHQDGKTGETK